MVNVATGVAADSRNDCEALYAKALDFAKQRSPRRAAPEPCRLVVVERRRVSHDQKLKPVGFGFWKWSAFLIVDNERLEATVGLQVL